MHFFLMMISFISCFKQFYHALPLQKASNNLIPPRIRLTSCYLSTSTHTDPSIISSEPKMYDIKGLKAEIGRLSYRTLKKIEKINGRYIENENTPSEESKSKDNLELDELQIKLNKLTDLETSIKHISSIHDKKFLELIPKIEELKINDSPPARVERGPKKIKAENIPRKPYKIVNSIENIEIRIGRSASDNDELSCDPIHRDDLDWWLHVADSPGSHVVIRSHDNDILRNHPETVMDAAVLAVLNSSIKNQSKVTVHLTRCENVSKPQKAKPGLVQLSGKINSINVNMKSQHLRIQRFQTQN